MSVVVRNPRQEELATVWEVLCGAFGEEPRERFRRQIWEDSTFELEQIRIAEVDGKIVSHVWVAERPVFYRGQVVLPMGGIGGVGTLPEYRGRGLATLLLEDAIAYMERKGHAISMLFTGINPFYAKLGWADFPEWRFRLQVRRVPDESEMPEKYSVRPCELEKDLPDLRAVYKSHAKGLQLSLCHARPDKFWLDGHPQYLGLKPSHVVVKEISGQKRVVGYACAFPTEQGLRLSEFAYDPQHPQAVVAMAVALAREAKTDRERRSRGRHHAFHAPATPNLSEPDWSDFVASSFRTHDAEGEQFATVLGTGFPADGENFVGSESGQLEWLILLLALATGAKSGVGSQERKGHGPRGRQRRSNPFGHASRILLALFRFRFGVAVAAFVSAQRHLSGRATNCAAQFALPESPLGLLGWRPFLKSNDRSRLDNFVNGFQFLFGQCPISGGCVCFRLLRRFGARNGATDCWVG
jgi:predicted N-acetyltransferase YhbS